MPLIVITCDKIWYPPEQSNEDGPLRAFSVVGLVEALPDLFIENREKLLLDPITEATDVLVDLRRFHRLAQNAPEVWLLLTLTEKLAAVEWEECSYALERILRTFYHEHDLARPPMDVDLMPGGVGFKLDRHGHVTKRW